MEAKIIECFKKDHGIELVRLPRKKILFEAKLKNGETMIIAIPKSKEYKQGYGWVDFTEIQFNLFKEYDHAYSLFCIENIGIKATDLSKLAQLINDENMHENAREGRHWKFNIWPDKLVIQKGQENLEYVGSGLESISAINERVA